MKSTVTKWGYIFFVYVKRLGFKEWNCSALLKRKRCNLSRTGFSILKFMKTKMIAIWQKKREQKMTFWFGSPLYLSFRLINAYAIKYVHLNLLVQLFKVVVSYFFFSFYNATFRFFWFWCRNLIGRQHQILAIFGAKIQSSLRNIAL